MQNTRLNSLIDASANRFTQWLRNPWRRFSLLILSLLFGNFLATAISTISGQEADLDILAALILAAFAEWVSWLVYRPRRRDPAATQPPLRPLALDALNGVKLGLIYGMFVEAFKLGS